jgi:hypothetical protein
LTTRTLFFLLSALATSAWAAPKRLVVAGPAPAVRLVELAVGRGNTLLKQEPLADDLAAPALSELARTSTASAVISLRLGPTEDVLDVFNGLDGASLLHLGLKHPKKAALKALPRPAAAQLFKAIAASRPPRPLPAPVPPDTAAADQPVRAPPPVAPPPEEPRPPAEAAAAPATAPAPAPEGEAPTIVRLAIGARGYQRSLKWTDDLFQRMPRYDLPLATAAAVDAELYPFAIVTRSPLSRLGVVTAFEQTLGLSSKDTEGQVYETNSMRFRVAAQYSQPISILTLRVHAGWSMQSFGFASVSSAQPKVNIPDVRYAALRGGLAVGVRLIGPLSFEVGGAYQYVLSSGEIASSAFFARATTGGADFTADLTWRIFRNLEARLGAEYQRYWLTLNPQPGDPWIAGGALDEYRSLNHKLAWVL